MARISKITIVALASLVCASAHAQSWQPPTGGAVEMFRRADRPFLIGAISGGAGGEGATGAGPPEPQLHYTDRTLDFELVPVEHWDTSESPAGKGVEGARVHFYRPGDHSPSFSNSVEEPVALPVGRWYLVGEAPGWVTTHEISLQVRQGERGGGGLVIPVMAACEVRFDKGVAWDAVDRLDVVSLTESAVYPLVPDERASTWVPAGRILTYAVAGEQITGLGAERSCEPGDHLSLAPPAKPAAGRQALIVETKIPGGRSAAPGGVELVVEGGESMARTPDAFVRMGDRDFSFFTDLPAVPLQVRLAGPGVQQGGEEATHRLGGEEKTVRLVRLESPPRR